MKKTFDWYIKPKSEEIKNIWENGILTVDANVLLDLYRYHTLTRQNLLDALDTFRKRLWISHQAATEFIRNRHTVIASANKTFGAAADEMENLKKNTESAISKLKGNRLVSRAIIEELEMSLNAAISIANEKLEESSTQHPDYFTEDKIFEHILDLFNNAIGEDFPMDRKSSINDEGQKRIDENIPPGYLDAGKDDARSKGDFFLWRQVLDFAKTEKKPIILVTSERKDDWWEKHQGKTVSPRMELLQEAAEYTKQKIIIYQTEHFLTVAADRKGETLDDDIFQEIRDINRKRAHRVKSTTLLSAYQNIETASDILNWGHLHVLLKKPLDKVTASGQLEPPMVLPPEVSVRLLNAPEDMPVYRLKAGTGTNFDFHVHIISEEYGTDLPIGEYKFEYIAKAESGRSSEETPKNPSDALSADTSEPDDHEL